MLALLLAIIWGEARISESILPSLKYSRVCSTTIELRNLGDRPLDALLEPHRASGSLVALVEQTGLAVHLGPGEEQHYTLKIPEVTENAWVAVRETIPDRSLTPILSVTGETACNSGNRIDSAVREVAHPLASPWFDGDVGEMAGARISVINTSETYVVVTGCYSSGTWVSNPNVPGGAALMPLCTSHFREQIPPFSAVQYPVVRGGNSHFTLHTSGRGVALQMLRLLDAGTQLFQVDSSISFGK